MLEVFGQTYHWSLMQVEYATDLAFRSAATLGPLYEQLIRQSVLSVKAEQVASFLGRQITPQLAQEIGSQFSTRIEGTCIKHRFGKCLDQDVRQVRHRAAHRNHDQRRVLFQAPPKGGTPQRPGDPRTGAGQEVDLQPDRPARDTARLQQALSRASVRPGRLLRWRSGAGPADQAARGGGQDGQGDQLLRIRSTARCCTPCKIHGSTSPASAAPTCCPDLGMLSPTRLSRQLRRLLDIGVIKRVTGTYRYYLTKAGRAATAAAERITEAIIVPTMI